MKQKKDYIRLIWWLPAIAMMIAIFCFSAQPAEVSEGTSSPIALLFLNIWEKIFGLIPEDIREEKISQIEFIVRKGAHITEYCLLSLFVSLPLWKLHRLRGIKFLAGVFLIPVAYACTDEFHQVFIEGRSGSPVDVGIDSIGILAGCLLAFLITCFCKRNRKNKK